MSSKCCIVVGKCLAPGPSAGKCSAFVASVPQNIMLMANNPTKFAICFHFRDVRKMGKGEE